jgi:predicted nuclease of restriction endonuclease-like (RecB) superfamily
MSDKNKLKVIEKGQSPSDQSDNEIYNSIRAALAEARTNVVVAVNSAMVSAYWEIGRQITEAVGERAEYGRSLLVYLSERLTSEFGKGFTVANLRNMRQFYQTFPNRYALRSELTWTHYRLLMRVDEPNRREFYLTESADAGWTSRQLERQINSFYYERLLATQKEYRPEVAGEIFKLEPKKDADYVLKDPYILEFLDLKENRKYSETELEPGINRQDTRIFTRIGEGIFICRATKTYYLRGRDPLLYRPCFL